MRQLTSLRLTLASAVLLAGGASGALVLGCSSDSSSNPVTDGGTSDAARTDGATTTDAGVDAAKPLAPRVSLVHASASSVLLAASPPAGAVRFCVNSSSGPMFVIDKQLPEVVAGGPVGLPFGSGGSLTDQASVAPLASSLPSIDIYAYAVPATVDPALKCSQLFTDAGTPDPTKIIPLRYGGALDGADAYKIPAGTFKLAKSYLVIAIGCPSAETGSVAELARRCGADFQVGTPNVGNLRLEIVEVDRATTVAAESIGGQFLHLSPQLGATKLQVALAAPLPGADGGKDMVTLATDSVYASSPVPAPATLASSASAAVDFSQSSLFFTLPAGAPDLEASFVNIAYATTGVADPTAAYFKKAKGYTFIAIGDPALPPPPNATDARFLRVIALPNN